MSHRLYVETYGCQMNLADTELILGHVGRHAWTATSDPAAADVILLNTCAIREHAEERVVGRLTDLARLKARRRELVLGVCGCMAQHHRAALTARVPALDLVVGPDAYRRLPALLDALVAERRGDSERARRTGDGPLADTRLDPDETYADIASARTPGAVRAWVTVMRGCDRFCTFCVVPYVRGRERSLPLDAVLAEVRAVAAAGTREVVLLGQTVNAWRDGSHDFADLLRAVAIVDGIARVRFTSPHPTDVSPRMIRAMAEVPEVAPQIHLPVQSASDTVLARMDRGYGIDAYRRLVAELRSAVPDLALSTDVIVGFPGETDDDFAATCALLEEIGYEQAFLYKYSSRSLTRAAKWGETVDEAEKGRRLAHVIALQEAIGAARLRGWVGRDVEVLVEGPARSAGHVAGKTPQFLTAIIDGPAEPGTLVRATVAATTSHTLLAFASASAGTRPAGPIADAAAGPAA